VTIMSSSSHARVSSRTIERRTANDNGSSQPRASGHTSRSEREDPRNVPSPQQPTSGTTHRRLASGSQRTTRGVEERRTERTQITTRETLTSRTRSPEKRPGPAVRPTERTRQDEPTRSYSGESRPKSRVETPQGMRNPF
jgi:gamma-tubulin complex component 2